jgi:hypothetical protein
MQLAGVLPVGVLVEGLKMVDLEWVAVLLVEALQVVVKHLAAVGQ